MRKKGESVSLSLCEVAWDEVAKGEDKREGKGVSSHCMHSLSSLHSVGH